jgi:integrative and conjugative element protein (TIGR02256 family)
VEFYTLDAGEVLASPYALTLPRAIALQEAMVRHRDFVPAGWLRFPTRAGAAREAVLVDVQTHGVPKHNAYGLKFQERLAIVVTDEPGTLPMVYALRKGFPRLAHQHQEPQGSPAQLCLYFEPTETVLRTWTPQQFLHRIQWWMEKNARGELHLADQPLDRLFFNSKYELVLPWNFEVLVNKGTEFMLVRAATRPDGGETLRLKPKTGEAHATGLLVELKLSPIIGGAVELNPATLGQLEDLVLMRGSSLLCAMKPQFQALVHSQGATTRAGNAFTVILLHVPLCREEGVAPERIDHRAFLLTEDALEIGVATGALMRHEGRIYSAIGVFCQQQPTAWRELPVLPLEVLNENTPKSARAQSGLASDDDPSGVLVGAGSLGSALAMLWGRAGYGRWTVIDKDHLRPHNLSRHTAEADQIGQPKAEAVALLQAWADHDANPIKPLVASATDPQRSDVLEALRSANWVIDASASLDYPRYASTLENVARHVSAFFAPSASSAIALVEDAARSIRLRTLEAQYYRAIIRSDWGREHLEGNLGAFWSGAGCRDISMVLPYSRVMLMAGLLADDLPRFRAQEGAAIRVWNRRTDGGVDVHDVPTFQERSFELGDLQVYLDAGLEKDLRALRLGALPNETGGVLLGYYDFTVRALVLVAALPAPADSTSTAGSFERGVDGLKEAVGEASRRTAGVVGYVGEWHSHPRGHSAAPSSDDVFQLVQLALGMDADGLPGVQLIVGENDIQVLSGAVG